MAKKLSQWFDPMQLAQFVVSQEEFCVFLYSANHYEHSGRFSYLAFGKKDECKDFNSFKNKIDQQSKDFNSSWFGYLAYEIKNQLEKKYKPTPKSYIEMPELWMLQFAHILCFDHLNKEIIYHGTKLPTLKPQTIAQQNIKIAELSSNMTKKQYLQKVEQILAAIKKGTFYQANLTRKFFGKLAGDYNKFAIFHRLCQTSPAPYAAFLKFADKYVISSSPERFMRIEPDGKIDTRPIKGSLHSSKDKDILLQSSKDRAENLMIVDLMRNDLARSSIAGSVKVTGLFDVTSYATIHHMSSTIIAQKKPEISNFAAINAAFPPGSMTGAPKIKAVEICDQLESMQRGVYSGCIGYFGADNSADFSVTIRTIIIADDKFEFQLGGAIIYDSDPVAEWQETLTKGRGIMAALNIDSLADL